MAEVRQSAHVTGAAKAASADEGWHAQFSPSSSERWIACPGSIAATRGCPSTSNDFSREGTAAHLLASRALDYKRPAAFWIGQEIEVESRVFTVDDDMAGHVQTYLDDLLGRVGDGTLLHEQRVWFSETIGVPDQGGTSDGIILSGDCRHLTVEDLKYGMGVQVNAEENTQMMTYALGVLETFAAVMDQVEEVTLVICQPRLDHLSEWTCSMDRLREHAATIREAAERAQYGIAFADDGEPIPEALFKVTEDGCRWCPIKATCEHYRKHVSALVFNDFDVLEDPATVEVIGRPAIPAGPSLGQMFGALELIEDWCRGVRGEVERMVLAGMDVIGPDGQRMKIIEGKKGRRAWRDQEAAKAALAGQLTPDKYLKPQPIISPSDAEKLLGRGKGGKTRFAEQFGPLIVQPPGKAKVALGSHPGAPYTPSADADEFANLEGQDE